MAQRSKGHLIRRHRQQASRAESREDRLRLFTDLDIIISQLQICYIKSTTRELQISGKFVTANNLVRPSRIRLVDLFAKAHIPLKQHVGTKESSTSLPSC